MRGGICTVQQALTPEATTTVKQAVGLARRRGHAQVTPLHVASAMLAAAPASLLRKACLQCHSHPLQCKALELCFNVALNRLPASSPSPLLLPPPPPHHHHHHHGPSFSNALVAAFKRAQAHQRRGSSSSSSSSSAAAAESPPPILALKIELDQLVISILDDPSVSRVMREAGFSSPVVKSRVEQAVVVSLNPSAAETMACRLRPYSPPEFEQSSTALRAEDVNGVLSAMIGKRRNTVVVGESSAAAENVARGAMEAVERSGRLRLVNLPLSSLRNISDEEAQKKVAEIRTCVAKSHVARGVLLYLGDLSLVSELWSSSSSSSSGCCYFAMEQIIMELKRLVSCTDNTTRVWLMAVSTFQAYVKCKTGNPSLETLWQLHPLTIPLGTTLSLSLKFESDVVSNNCTTKASKDIIINIGDDEKHTHCSCSVDLKHNNYNSISSTTASNLPSWLQKYRDENNRISPNTHHQEYCITVGDLCKKWNSFCSPVHKNPNFAEKPFNFSSLSPSNPIFSPHDNFNHTLPNKDSPPPKEYQFWAMENSAAAGDDQRHRSYESDAAAAAAEAKPELLSNPNSSPNSASSSEVIMDNDDEDDGEDLQSFKALNAESLRTLRDEMEREVPWQKEIVSDIATTVLQCRSGTSQRKVNNKCQDENCWLFFLGPDSEGKEKVARSLAKLIFGSSRSNGFVSIGLNGSSFSPSDRGYKRTRDESSDLSHVERLGEAVNENPRRVFFVEDLEELDRFSLKGIERAIESGKITLRCGETVQLRDSIVIFSCESFAGGSSNSGSRASSPKRSSSLSQKSDNNNNNNIQDEVSLDLNIAVVVLHDQDRDINEGSDSINVGILESVDGKFDFRVQEL